MTSFDVESGTLYKFDSELADYICDLLRTRLSTLPIHLPDGNYILGGGAIRSFYDNTPTRDLDIFVPSMEQFMQIVEAVADIDPRVRRQIPQKNSEAGLKSLFSKCIHDFTTLKLGTFKYPFKRINMLSLETIGIQFLCVEYAHNWREHRGEDKTSRDSKLEYVTSSTIEEILDGFDLTVCQAAMSFSVTKVVSVTDLSTTKFIATLGVFRTSKQFYRDVAKRTIHRTNPKLMFPCGPSLLRLHKYLINYHYNVDQTELKLIEHQRAVAFSEGVDPLNEYGVSDEEDGFAL